jgi:hypothetical protein
MRPSLMSRAAASIEVSGIIEFAIERNRKRTLKILNLEFEITTPDIANLKAPTMLPESHAFGD